ncbi:unnamed protein product [Trichobilharzia regenti]|nr:unnamed protein product [Trichobilharzia regenti]
MMDAVVDSAVAANRQKREWRHHKLPDSMEVIAAQLRHICTHTTEGLYFALNATSRSLVVH